MTLLENLFIFGCCSIDDFWGNHVVIIPWIAYVFNIQDFVLVVLKILIYVILGVFLHA